MDNTKASGGTGTSEVDTIHWNPNNPDFQAVKKTLEHTNIGNTPTAALDLVACGVQRAITSGISPGELRTTLEKAITFAEGNPNV